MLSGAYKSASEQATAYYKALAEKVNRVEDYDKGATGDLEVFLKEYTKLTGKEFDLSGEDDVRMTNDGLALFYKEGAEEVSVLFDVLAAEMG
jgi:hypothetical protein